MRALRDILGAIYRKDYPVLQTLTPEEASAPDSDGRTPLMHAVLGGDPHVVRALLGRGAAKDAVDHGRKWTALHFAADDANADNVRALLDAGASVDPPDTLGNTPLWRAVMSSSKSFDAVKALVDRGADPDRKNASGIAPIDVAQNAGLKDLVRLLGGS